MKISKKEVLSIIDYLEKEKGIPRDRAAEIIKESIQFSLEKTAEISELEIYIDKLTGTFVISSIREIVEVPESKITQISLREVQKTVPNANIGEYVRAPIDDSIMGRSVANKTWQILKKKIDDESIHILYKEYTRNKGSVISGVVVKQLENRSVIVDIGRMTAMLPEKYFPKTESYSEGDRVSAVLLEVDHAFTEGKTQIILSRSCNEYIYGLLSKEIPEINDETISIVNIARIPGLKCKVLATSEDPNIDVVGTCIGYRGNRMKKISADLKGEKIDVIKYSDNEDELIRNIFPNVGIKFIIRKELKTGEFEGPTEEIELVVDNEAFPIAVGKAGSNVRLASKLLNKNVKIYRATAFYLMVDEMKNRCMNLEIIDDKIDPELIGIEPIVHKSLSEIGIETYRDLLTKYQSSTSGVDFISLEKIYNIIRKIQSIRFDY